MKKNTLKKGFTLIELLFVISIIGILSSIVLQSLNSARDKAYNGTRLSNIDQIEKALQIYLTKTNNSLPTTSGSWQCVGLSSSICWNPPPNSIGGPFNPATDLNNALSGNISVIPKDPVVTTGPGDYYIYLYRISPTVTVQYLYGAGAYIRWRTSNSSMSCGRGYKWTTPTGTEFDSDRQCILYLGNN